MQVNWCLVLGHKWERLTDWLPVIPDRGEFEYPGATPMALGKCVRCGKREARRCHGHFTWGAGTYKSETTMQSALREWNKELEKKGARERAEYTPSRS